MIVAEHYEVFREIGRGGMSVVYHALDLERVQDVALKVMHPNDTLHCEDMSAFQFRFFSELLLTARVDHPHIVKVYDYGVLEDGAFFIAMELLQGHDLRQLLDHHGRLDPATLMHLFEGPLEALAQVHAQGIVHKDLKPSNLFVKRHPDHTATMVLTDFGIAHRLRDRRQGGPGGLTAFTPQYSAPEYLQHQHVSPALDVYQMGLILCEALLGRPLVAASSVTGCIMAHCEGLLDIPPLLLHGPLSDVITGALNRDPAQRFPHAGVLLEALREVDPSALRASLELVQLWQAAS